MDKIWVLDGSVRAYTTLVGPNQKQFCENSQHYKAMTQSKVTPHTVGRRDFPYRMVICHMLTKMFAPIKLQESVFGSKTPKQSPKLAIADCVPVYCKQ